MIVEVRGQKVMIDADLAELYGVPTKRLNQQVSRNRKRFPDDFMFQLTKTEAESLRLQFAPSKKGRGGRRTLPHVFTAQVLDRFNGNERFPRLLLLRRRQHVYRPEVW
jgi:hypothetical protein